MNIREEKGSVLILTLVVMLSLLLLGGALIQYAVLNARAVTLEEQSMQAYYIARSGADAMAEAIIKDESILSELGIQNIGDDATSMSSNLGDGHFVVTVTKLSNVVQIKSTGSVATSGKSKDVFLTLRAGEKSIFDYGVFSGQFFELGGLTIEGDVGVGVGGTVDLGKGSIEGTLYYGSETTISGSGTATNYEPHNSSVLAFPDIQVDLFLTTEPAITDTRRYDLEDGESKYVRVPSVDLSGGNQEIAAHGNGVLHLLVEDSFKLSGNAQVEAYDDSHIIIYYLGTSDVVIDNEFWLAGNGISNATIYAPNAWLRWSGGGNKKTIHTGGIYVQGFEGADSGNLTLVHDPTILADLSLIAVELGVSDGGYSRVRWSAQ